jgi:glycerate 2-kinase
LRRAAAAILAAGLRAVEPGRLVARHVVRGGRRVIVGGQPYTIGNGRLCVVAVGKAAVPMLRAVVDVIGQGVAHHLVAVSADAGGAVPPGTRRYLAGHPLPDRRGLAAARHVETLAGSLGPRDLLLLLLSGGSSALLPAPAGRVTLAEKAETTRLLLHAGATIHDVNVVRRHLSRLKGGGLARAAFPARVVTLALSDVVGDDLAAIGSGPTAADASTFAEALDVITRLGLRERIPRAVRDHLERGVHALVPETLQPGDPCLARVHNVVVGTNRTAVRAAAQAARRLGFETRVVRDPMVGEARELPARLLSLLGPAPRNTCLVAGGETTVTVRGRGCGGRNQEIAVAAARLLAGRAPRLVAALATDGIDGNTRAAGGVADETSRARARRLGLAPASAFLRENDAHGFLAALGDLLITGPTGTNVADLCVVLAGPG